VAFACAVFLALLAPIADALSISDTSVVEGIGLVMEKPIMEKNTFTLRCRVTLTSPDELVFCQWTHILPREFTSDNKEKKVICPAAGPNDQGAACRNPGGTADSSYASRISMDMSSTHCGIKVTNADPRDTGRWECHVADSSGSGAQKGALDIFASNQSRVFFKVPDLLADDNQVIIYDLEASRPEIDATCRGYGGSPEPKFVWYFEDDRNEIDARDMTKRTRKGKDSILGDYVEESITWVPTIDDMCRKYKLRQPVCDNNTKKNRRFNFNLLCKADQGDYYKTENLAQDASVIVEVYSGNRGAAGSLSKSGLLVATALMLLSAAKW